MNFRLFFLWFVLLPAIILGQDETGPMRVEIEAKAEVFQSIPCGNSGVLIFYETIDQIDEQNKSWFFVLYDTRLQTVWSKTVPVPLNFIYYDFYLEINQIHLAFQSIAKTRSDEYNFQVVSINLTNGETVAVDMFIPDKAELIRLAISGGKLIAGFNYFKEQALVIIKDLTTGDEAVIKFADNPSFIKDIETKPNSGQLWVALDVYVSRRESAAFLNEYDLTGQLLNSVMLAPTRTSEKLMNAQIHFHGENEIFILGSFNNLNGKMSRTENTGMGEQSEGFYIAGITDGRQSFIRTHKLLDFKNITQILNNQQLATAGNLLEKQHKKGKEQSLTYDFLIHDLVVNGDEFILLADAFYPEYRQISSMSYDFYGRPMPYYYTIFDGYRYFNAFVVGFDKNGNLTWSNGLKIWDIRTFRLARQTAFFADENEMVLFYNHEGKIVSKVIDGHDDIGPVENTKIATLSHTDVQVETSQGLIEHWYGNYFLASGYQVIRNNQYSGGSRKVFYLNKIVFD